MLDTRSTLDTPTTLTPVVSRGRTLESAPDTFGELRRSDDLAANAPGTEDVVALREGLHERIVEDGYVYLPGYLDRNEVLGARQALCQQLADLGLLKPGYPVAEAIVDPEMRLPVAPPWRGRMPPCSRCCTPTTVG
jgi:hypothetical protein